MISQHYKKSGPSWREKLEILKILWDNRRKKSLCGYRGFALSMTAKANKITALGRDVATEFEKILLPALATVVIAGLDPDKCPEVLRNNNKAVHALAVLEGYYINQRGFSDRDPAFFKACFRRVLLKLEHYIKMGYEPPKNTRLQEYKRLFEIISEDAVPVKPRSKSLKDSVLAASHQNPASSAPRAKVTKKAPTAPPKPNPVVQPSPVRAQHGISAAPQTKAERAALAAEELNRQVLEREAAQQEALRLTNDL